MNNGRTVLLKELIRDLLVDGPGQSLGDVIQGYLRNVEVTEAFIKPVRVLVTKLLKEVVGVSELHLPVSFSMMDLLP